MLFNSLNFIIFFAVVLILYYAVPKKLQWQFLLASSLAFYMSWKPELIFLLICVTAVNFTGGIAIESTEDKRVKKRRLTLALLLDFGILAIFKYLMFICNCFGWLYTLLGREYVAPELDIVLPAGISFYTFMAAGYLIDVYRGDIKSEKNFWHFATFMAFFPQIIAGPIERAGRMLPQLFTPKRLNADNISDNIFMGVKLMIWGYFKKLVIADRLSILVNTVFGSPTEFEGFSLIVATLCFTVQIYCDFSGYSDISRGVARTLGIDVINNFERPYFATSIREFWRRWHISLSTWFRDYLYIPLGGSRVGILRQWFNYMVTFAVSGLWHGASMSFVVWGALHGVYQIIGNIKYRIFGKRNKDKKLTPVLQAPINMVCMLITFLLVAFAWIFFKASNISDGIYIATHLLDNISAVTDKQYLYEAVNNLGLGLYELKMMAVAVLWLILSEAVSFKYEINVLMTKLPFVFRFVFYYVTVVIIVAMGVFSSGGDFIYFQF